MKRVGKNQSSLLILKIYAKMAFKFTSVLKIDIRS